MQLLPLGGQAVIALQVTGAGGGKQLIAVQHLPHRPAQGAGGLFGVGNDRHQQVRDAVIAAQLHHLGVDHQELDLLRGGLIQKADDNGIDADRFAAAGSAGDKQMRHFGQIGQADAPGNILAQGHRKAALGGGKFGAVDDLPDGNGGDVLIGHLDADGGFIGDGRLDAHPACRQVQGDIIGQIGDAADLDAGRGLQFIPGNGRPAGNIHDAGLDPEAAQRIHQQVGIGAQLLLGIAAAGGLGLFQQVDRREGVGFFLRHRLQQHLLGGLRRLFLRRFAKVQLAVLGFGRRLPYHGAAADGTGDEILDGGLGGGGGGIGDGRRDRLEIRLGFRRGG